MPMLRLRLQVMTRNAREMMMKKGMPLQWLQYLHSTFCGARLVAERPAMMIRAEEGIAVREEFAADSVQNQSVIQPPQAACSEYTELVEWYCPEEQKQWQYPKQPEHERWQ